MKQSTENPIALGLLLTVVGGGLSLALLEDTISGVVIVGFIPIPLIIVFPLVALVGIVFFVQGVIAAFRRR